VGPYRVGFVKWRPAGNRTALLLVNSLTGGLRGHRFKSRSICVATLGKLFIHLATVTLKSTGVINVHEMSTGTGHNASGWKALSGKSPLVTMPSGVEEVTNYWGISTGGILSLRLFIRGITCPGTSCPAFERINYNSFLTASEVMTYSCRKMYILLSLNYYYFF